jgi:hypothetical protein
MNKTISIENFDAVKAGGVLEDPGGMGQGKKSGVCA